jgi:hypothetical protein
MALASAIEPLRIANRYLKTPYTWRLLSLDGNAVADDNGILIQPHGSIAEEQALGTVILCADIQPDRYYSHALRTWLHRLKANGTTLGAMDTGYQRGKIQDESMHYEMLKHTGELPIIGVNTFKSPHANEVPQSIELARSTDEEKQSQLKRLNDFHSRHAQEAQNQLARLQQAVLDNANVFEVLMDAVRHCSLGQITASLFEVGGQYRRNM